MEGDEQMLWPRYWMSHLKESSSIDHLPCMTKCHISHGTNAFEKTCQTMQLACILALLQSGLLSSIRDMTQRCVDFAYR